MNWKRNWGRKMADNKTLGKAKENKNDEFYTRKIDIENELRHYKEFFRGQIVYCNCDDPYESNFFKYFALNFNHLQLKKLIAISYANSPVAGSEVTLFEDQGKEFKINNRKAYKVVMSELKDVTGDGRENLDDVREIIRHRIRYLKGDGDFRSPEAVELLKEATIVVTNPPFSLFREYIGQLIEYDKKFIIIGNPNAIHYKEVFPLLKNNKVFVGYKSMGVDMLFDVSPEFADFLVKHKKEGSGYRVVDGVVKGRANAIWFTNFTIDKIHDELQLYKHYTPEEYPKYDNYNAINVDKVSDIPCDYYEAMGVPDSFLEKYNPEQFEIIGLGCGNMAKEIGVTKNYRGRTDVAYMKNGVPKCPYSRVIIKRKRDE